MRPLPSQYLQGIFKSTQVVGLVLGLGGLVFLGGVCTKIPETNINSAVSSTNIGSNSNVGANAVVNTNTNTGTNSNFNTNSSELDTSDWLTYTNEEYGFSFRYPGDWIVHVIDKNNEGGMGLNMGSIVISSGICRAQGDLINIGTIEKTKKSFFEDESKSLIEINRHNITGIRYYDVVNENHDKGFVYMYLFGQNEMSFGLVDNPTDKNCQKIFEEMMATISINS